jgi:hypothetical protein
LAAEPSGSAGRDYIKYWANLSPYTNPTKVSVLKDAPKTSARTVKEKHKNLTLHDWMTVFAFIDQHPRMTQGDIMKHFASKSDGALSFN